MAYQLNAPPAQRFVALHEAVLAVAEEFERGQASIVLQDRVRELCPSTEHAPLCVGIVPHGGADRTEALGWLLGDVFRTSTHADVAGQRLLEIPVADARNGALELLPPALAHDGRGGSRLQVSENPGVRALTLLVAPDIDMLLADFSMENHLRARSDLLLVAASAEAEFSGVQVQLLQDLFEAIPAWAPLVTSGAETSPPRWVLTMAANPTGLALLPMRTAARSPALFGNPAEEFRQLLQLFGRGRPLKSLADELSRWCQQRLEELRGIRNPRDLAGAANRRQVDRPCDALISDVNSALEVPAPDGRRLPRALPPTDPLMQEVEAQLRSFGPEDLVREPARRRVNLRLAGKRPDSLRRTLRDSLLNEVGEEIKSHKRRLGECKVKVQEQLSSLCGRAIVFEFQSANELDLRQRMDNLLDLDIKYKGDLPVNNFLTWFSDGRSKLMGLFGVMAFFGIFFGGGSSRRVFQENPLLGAILGAIFIALVFFGFHNRKQDEKEKIESELEKVREQLKRKCDEVLVAARQEKHDLLKTWLGQCKAYLVGEIKIIDEILKAKENQEEQAAGVLAEQEYSKAQALIRSLDVVSKDLVRAISELAKVDEKAELQRAATRSGLSR